jgi:MYXO-CTERM domain-containing protein
VQEASQTFSDECVVTKTTFDDATAKSPGMPLAGALAALGAVAALLRRRNA